MKLFTLKNIGLFLLLFVNFSCAKRTSKNNSSWPVTYELSGNYTGSKFAFYSTASGADAVDTVPALPWSKEINYQAGVTVATIAVSGSGGTPGQQVTLLIKKRGVITSITTAMADSAGSVTCSAFVMNY